MQQLVVWLVVQNAAINKYEYERTFYALFRQVDTTKALT